MPTFQEILTQLDTFAKSAEAESENITGEPVSSMPGAENDKPAPTGATEADPKVKDDTIDNMKSRTTDGATPDGDIPASNTNKYEADEPVLTADKKPELSTDVNAKTAASKANGIVDFILSKKAAKPAPAAKPEPAQKPAPAQKQAAPENSITLDMGLLAKIAAITLADEEGQWAVQQALTKRAGAEFAKEMLDTLEKRAAEAQAQEDFIKGAQDAEAMIGDMQEAQGAQDAEQAIGDMQEAQGAEDAEQALVDELDQYSPEEIADAVQQLANEGNIPPEAAQQVISEIDSSAQAEEPSDEISEEDLAEVITQAVEAGKLTPEDAQALAASIAEDSSADQADQALQQDVAQATAGEDAAAAGAGEGAAAAAPTEAEKTASANRASFKQQLVDILSRK